MIASGAWRAVACDKALAARAKAAVARLQRVIDGDALVEDETFAVPSALLGRHLLEIGEDAAFKVIDLVEPFSLEECGGLSQRMPPVQNIATRGIAPSASRAARKRRNQSGNSRKLRVPGSIAPSKLPSATS